jgi:hypothetical protein
LEDIIRNLEEEIDSGSPLPPDHNFHS